MLTYKPKMHFYYYTHVSCLIRVAHTRSSAKTDLYLQNLWSISRIWPPKHCSTSPLGILTKFCSCSLAKDALAQHMNATYTLNSSFSLSSKKPLIYFRHQNHHFYPVAAPAELFPTNNSWNLHNCSSNTIGTDLSCRHKA